MMCSRCGDALADGKSGYCPPCASDYGREHRAAHPEYYRWRRRERREKTQRLMLDFLADRQCLDCGERDPVVLQFDHLGDKITNISWAVHNGWSWTRLMTEIDKCEIVCANCHARRTARRVGWYCLE